MSTRKTSGSTGVDLFNVENRHKFTRHQVNYMKKYIILFNEGKSITECADGKLICQEVVDKADEEVDSHEINVYSEEESN
eukprot:1956003-Ditylum_brightwellii.AAC.1